MNQAFPFSICTFLAVASSACGVGESIDDGFDVEDSVMDPAAPSATVEDDASEEPDAASAPAVDQTPALSEGPSDAALSGSLEAAEDSGAEPVEPATAERAPLVWRNCGQFSNRNYECAELQVPVDHAQPDGETFSLALRRIVANPLEPYRGALLVNPGGPGGEGIDFALQLFEFGLFEQVAPGFDIIGFDPRGVAESGERGCGIAPPELYPGAEQATEWTDERAAQDLREYGERCRQEWGSLFDRLGSNNVVRDMEEIRKALGERVLNFYGASYGTRLGALYAHYYPETTGRIVLDAPVHPRASFVEVLRGQYNEVARLHGNLLAACEAETIVCPPQATEVFERLVDNARSRGLAPRVLGYWRALFASGPGLEILLDALAREAADPGGDWIEGFVPYDGDDSADVAYFSVTCADDVFEPPALEEVALLRDEFAQVNPLLATAADQAVICAGWPATPDPVPLPTALDAQRILVIGGTADPRTPYPWAQSMAETLGNATLLTSRHYGHGALAWGGECVRTTIRAYLTTGSLPALGAECE